MQATYVILNCLVAALNKEKEAGEVHFNKVFSLKNHHIPATLLVGM